MTDPVGHRLYQHRLVLIGSDLSGCYGGVVHGQHVIPVHPDGRHPVGRASHSDSLLQELDKSYHISQLTVSPVLFTDGGWDGVAIIAAEKNHISVSQLTEK